MVGAKANRSFVGEQDSSNPLATSQASRGTSKLSLFPMYIAPVHNYKHVVFEWTLFEEPRWRIILASWNLPTTKCLSFRRRISSVHVCVVLGCMYALYASLFCSAGHGRKPGGRDGRCEIGAATIDHVH